MSDVSTKVARESMNLIKDIAILTEQAISDNPMITDSACVFMINNKIHDFCQNIKEDL